MCKVMLYNYMFVDERWLVDKILVKENEHAVQEYVFPCYNWLESTVDQHADKTIICTGIVFNFYL